MFNTIVQCLPFKIDKNIFSWTGKPEKCYGSNFLVKLTYSRIWNINFLVLETNFKAQFFCYSRETLQKTQWVKPQNIVMLLGTTE